MLEVKPKIAIATIFHEQKFYSYQLALDWMKNQTYHNVEFIVRVDTGKYGEHHKLKGIRESIRLQAIELDVDALFCFDCDTIAPLNVIETFLETPADLMSGIYFSRTASNRAVCWLDGDPGQQFLNADVYTKITAAGMGCCFSRRGVLEACTFDWAVPDDDYYWYHQAKKLGFRILSLNMVRCRHYTSYTSYIYHEFGEIENIPTDEYVVLCPDGITLNGNFYPCGKAIIDHKLLKTIMELDEPYRTGKIKFNKRRVDVVSKKEAGITQSHSGRQIPARVPSITKGKKETEVGVWKRSPR